MSENKELIESLCVISQRLIGNAPCDITEVCADIYKSGYCEGLECDKCPFNDIENAEKTVFELKNMADNNN